MGFSNKLDARTNRATRPARADGCGGLRLFGLPILGRDETYEKGQSALLLTGFLAASGYVGEALFYGYLLGIARHGHASRPMVFNALGAPVVFAD